MRNTEVLVISPEEAREVAAFWRNERMPMPGLADPGHEVATRYGQQVSLLQLGRLPTMVLLDRSGAIRFEHRGSSMIDYPSHKKLLTLLDELNAHWADQAVSDRPNPERWG